MYTIEPYMADVGMKRQNNILMVLPPMGRRRRRYPLCEQRDPLAKNKGGKLESGAPKASFLPYIGQKSTIAFTHRCFVDWKTMDMKSYSSYGQVNRSH